MCAGAVFAQQPTALVVVSGNRRFCHTNQVRHLRGQQASALSPPHYDWPPLTEDHPMTQQNESSDGKRLNRRRKYRLELNEDLARTHWGASLELVCQRGSATSLKSEAQTHSRRPARLKTKPREARDGRIGTDFKGKVNLWFGMFVCDAFCGNKPPPPGT